MTSRLDEAGGVVTLYNRIGTGGEQRWQRTVLRGVAVLDCQGEAIRHSGAAASSARRIGPVSVGELSVIIPRGVKGGYLTPLAWRMTDDRAGCWTMQPGDIITVGDCPLELLDDTITLMDGCERFATINSVTDFCADCLLAHWEVSAR